MIVYLRDDLSPSDRDLLMGRLHDLYGFTTYVSKEQAWDEMRQQVGDPTLLEASSTLGAPEPRTFARVAVPLSLPSLVTGAALAWGRALGEFGATLMFAGSFRGVTQTAPLAIFELLGTDFEASLALAAVLVAVSGALLLALKLVGPAEVRIPALR